MKDRQSLTVFVVVMGAILLAGIFCYTQLEIVPATTWTNPSRETRTNQYLALDRWLEGLGYGVRSAAVGGVEAVLKGPEKTVFIENSRFTWLNKERLLPWIREGGHLIVSLDLPPGEVLREFMEALGVKCIDNSRFQDEADAKTPEISKIPSRENSPYFDWQTTFTVTEETSAADKILLMGNRSGAIKLVKLELDKGWAVFTGKASFLHNYSLRHNENINLTGELFITEDAGRDILFIRMMSGERHFLGNLAERGNPAALAVSLALLVAAGFWMAIPSFGRYKPEPERPGKPLRERFLAEGRFLAKYHALSKYSDVYRRELEQRNRSRGIETPPSAVLSPTLGEFIKEQKLLSEQLEKFNQTNTGRNYGRPNN